MPAPQRALTVLFALVVGWSGSAAAQVDTTQAPPDTVNVARDSVVVRPDSVVVEPDSVVVSVDSLAGPDSIVGRVDSVRGRRRPHAAVGAMVGYSQSDLIGPDAQQLESRQGSLTGVYLLAPLSGHLAFRPELLFSLKGGRTQTANALLDIELAYLELPLLAKFVFTRKRFRPLLFAGPAPALQIGCDVQFIGPDQATRSTCGEGSFSLFRSFDIGFVGGAGIEARWPQSALALEARYTAGLRSIIGGSEVRNRAFGLVLALTF